MTTYTCRHCGGLLLSEKPDSCGCIPAAKEQAERPLDAATCSPGDIANGLLHAADDHPCCRGTLYAAANLLEEMKNTIHQREQAARLVRRLLRSHGEKSSRRADAARSDAGLWLARYDQENANVDLPPRTSPQNKQDAYGG